MASSSGGLNRSLVLFFGVLGVYILIFLIGSYGIVETDDKRSFLRAFQDDARQRQNQNSVKQRSDAAASKRTAVSTKQQLCKYEGHCPVGTTCVVNPDSSSLGGICQPYRYEQETKRPQSLDGDDACIRACLDQVEWDEKFYWEGAPNVTGFEATLDDSQRPSGCLVKYRRLFKKEPGALDEWHEATKAKRIVRVDPFGKPANTAQEQVWTAFCYAPCQTDTDCGTSGGFECRGGACHRRPGYWNRTDDPDQREMVILTGATSGYFRGLQNLCASLRYWAPKNRVVVYNLGMKQEELDVVETWSNVVELKWKEGIPKEYPAHVHVGKRYAWKPIAINESLHEYHSVFWLDAGSTVVGPITEAERINQQTGAFLTKGQDLDMKGKSHPLTYKYFGKDKETFHAGPHFSGNTQAFLYPSRYVDTIVKPNAACAVDPACITPEGSSLGNHRYDQTTLSILAYMPHVQAPHHTEYLAASRPGTDLLQPSSKFIWTARQGCHFYIDRERSMQNNKR